MAKLWDWFLRDPLPQCQIQTASLIGPRAENQDNYLVIAPNSSHRVTARWLQNGVPQEASRQGWSANWVRLALMDGIGGHANGREIAEAASLELRSLPFCPTLERQRRALFNLHHKLQTQFAGGQRSPGATLVWAEIDRHSRTCNLLNVGDSRAWLWNGNAWQRLTWDHTSLEFGFRDGRVDANSYKNLLEQPEHRIAQALGYGSWGMRQDRSGNSIFGFGAELRLDTADSLQPHAKNHVDISSFILPPGSFLLLASDGLWNATKAKLPIPPNITANSAQTLAQEAVDAGGKDNTTLILAMFS